MNVQIENDPIITISISDSEWNKIQYQIWTLGDDGDVNVKGFWDAVNAVRFSAGLDENA